MLQGPTRVCRAEPSPERRPRHGFLRKRRRAAAVTTTGGAQAPGAEAHSAEDSEDDGFDEKHQHLRKKQHAAVRPHEVQAYLGGRLLDKEESGNVK